MPEMPEGFDPASLMSEVDEGREPAAEAPGEEKPTPAPEKPEAKDDDDDDYLTLDEVEKRMAAASEAGAEKAVRKVVAEARKETETPVDPKDAEIARLTGLLDEQAEAAKAAAEKRLSIDAEHEVKSCVGKHKMTAAQRDLTIDFFDTNPALEGVWSFERAALYVNPELRDHPRPSEAAQNGQPAREHAKVVARGASGAAAPAAPKYTSRRGYSEVSDAIRKSPAMTGLFHTARD